MSRIGTESAEEDMMRPYPWVRTVRVLGLIATLLIAASSRGAPGDLDTSFGAGGVVSTDLKAIAALQPDGKLIVVGTVDQMNPARTSWLIRRYNSDGSPDLSFGENDSVIVSFGVTFPDEAIGNDYPNAISLLPDGRFVVAGTTGGSCTPFTYICESLLSMARFNADGTLDGTFGSNGKVLNGEVAGATSVAIQNGVKVLTFTGSSSSEGQQAPLLHRFNVDGSLDTTFAATIACTGDGTFRVDQDDTILVATFGNTGICITRLGIDGAPDIAFGMQGAVTVGTGSNPALHDFFIDANDAIVVGSLAGGKNVLVRLTPYGNLDPSFGQAGIATLDELVPAVGAMAGDCQGRTIAGGGTVFAMLRVLQDGAIDSAFTATPPGSAPMGFYLYEVNQILVRPNGRIIALAIDATAIPSTSVVNIIQYMGDQPCSLTPAVEYYYPAWNYYFETASPTEIAALDGGAFGGAWQRTGETFNVWSQPNASASPTCRFFSTAFAPKSSHFYTPFAAECAAVKTNPDWEFESIAFYIQIPTGYGTGNGYCPQGTVALYRAYNNGMGGAPNHRYTTRLDTLNSMLSQGWMFEGEANTRVFACVPQ